MKTFQLESYENGLQSPVVIEPDVFHDERGYFVESYNEKRWKEILGDINFVQDNESKSCYGVLRGLHFQAGEHAQAKLVRVVKGQVIDVIVDIRPESEYFGKYYYVMLSAENHRQFFVPRGFAHGFVTLEDETIFQYKCDNYYDKESERGIIWNDEDINIPWLQWIDEKDIILSEKDKLHPSLKIWKTSQSMY